MTSRRSCRNRIDSNWRQVDNAFMVTITLNAYAEQTRWAWQADAPKSEKRVLLGAATNPRRAYAPYLLPIDNRGPSIQVQARVGHAGIGLWPLPGAILDYFARQIGLTRMGGEKPGASSLNAAVNGNNEVYSRPASCWKSAVKHGLGLATSRKDHPAGRGAT